MNDTLIRYGFIFIAAGVVIVIAGTTLARCADAIAEHTRLGGLWVGGLLLAGATSLPELGTDIAAVRLGAADLAVGDLFGSSMANMLILALVDLSAPRREVFRRATLDHALAACLAMSINGLAAVAILAPIPFSFAGLSPEPLILAGVYLFGTRAIFRHVRRDREPATLAAADAIVSENRPLSMRRAVIGFSIAALVTLAVAPVFAWAAKGIAETTGLGATFVGTWLVGFSTSLPELVASLAAIRMGAIDLAVGNLFGSNAFNMAILIVLDIVNPGGPILRDISRAHAISGLYAVILMSLGLAGIVYRAKKRFTVLEPDSALIVLVYVLALWSLYASRPIG